MALELNEANFEDEVIQSTQPVLVDFWAPWCGPCRSMAPILDDVAKEYEGKVKVGKVNVDQNQALAQKFGVMSIPTLIMYKEGKVAGQMVGYTPKGVLAKKLDQLL